MQIYKTKRQINTHHDGVEFEEMRWDWVRAFVISHYEHTNGLDSPSANCLRLDLSILLTYSAKPWHFWSSRRPMSKLSKHLSLFKVFHKCLEHLRTCFVSQQLHTLTPWRLWWLWSADDLRDESKSGKFLGSRPCHTIFPKMGVPLSHSLRTIGTRSYISLPVHSDIFTSFSITAFHHWQCHSSTVAGSWDSCAVRKNWLFWQVGKYFNINLIT